MQKRWELVRDFKTHFPDRFVCPECGCEMSCCICRDSTCELCHCNPCRCDEDEPDEPSTPEARP